MRSQWPKLLVILPLSAGIALSVTLVKIPVLTSLEHSLFWFPERTQKAQFFPDHGEPLEFKVTPLEFKRKGKSEPLVTYEIDQETRDILSTDFLAPSHWAYFLHIARKKGIETAIIAPPLSWEDAEEIPIRTLEHELSQFRRSAIGLAAEKSGEKNPLPAYLESSVISRNPALLPGLPEIDNILQAPSIQAPLFGIISVRGQIVETSSPFQLPLLVRWNKAILPTLELAALLAHQGLGPHDILIDPKGYLRLGPNGPILRIDPRGRTAMTGFANTPVSASKLLIDASTPVPKPLFLTDTESPQHLRQLALSVSEMSAQSPLAQPAYIRWELWFEITFLIAFTLLLQTRKLWLALPILAVAVVLSPVLASQWLVLTPFAAVLLTFLILPARKTAKISPPDPKPVEETEIVLDSSPEEATSSPVRAIKIKAPIKEVLKPSAKEKLPPKIEPTAIPPELSKNQQANPPKKAPKKRLHQHRKKKKK